MKSPSLFVFFPSPLGFQGKRTTLRVQGVSQGAWECEEESWREQAAGESEPQSELAPNGIKNFKHMRSEGGRGISEEFRPRGYCNNDLRFKNASIMVEVLAAAVDMPLAHTEAGGTAGRARGLAKGVRRSALQRAFGTPTLVRKKLVRSNMQLFVVASSMRERYVRREQTLGSQRC